MKIAERTDLSSDILDDLVDDINPEVCKKAMKNPNLHKDTVERILCNIEFDDAQLFFWYNPDFLNRNPDTFSKVIDYYVQSEDPFVMFISLLQPQVSQDILERKIHSEYWDVRFAVSQNPNTTTEMLLSLAEDCNQLVRAAAKDRLKQLQS